MNRTLRVIAVVVQFFGATTWPSHLPAVEQPFTRSAGTVPPEPVDVLPAGISPEQAHQDMMSALWQGLWGLEFVPGSSTLVLDGTGPVFGVGVRETAGGPFAAHQDFALGAFKEQERTWIDSAEEQDLLLEVYAVCGVLSGSAPAPGSMSLDPAQVVIFALILEVHTTDSEDSVQILGPMALSDSLENASQLAAEYAEVSAATPLPDWPQSCAQAHQTKVSSCYNLGKACALSCGVLSPIPALFLSCIAGCGRELLTCLAISWIEYQACQEGWLSPMSK